MKKVTQNKAENVEGIVLELGIHDRILMQGLLPKEGDFITIKMVRDICDRVGLSQGEIKKHNVRRREDGAGWQWNEPKEKKEFSFSSAEMELLKAKVSELDKTKKISNETLSLCEMIRDN